MARNTAVLKKKFGDLDDMGPGDDMPKELRNGNK